MDRLKRIRKQIKRLTGKIHKLEQKRHLLEIKEYCITDANALNEFYSKEMLNRLYGKMFTYHNTDSVKEQESKSL